MMNLGGLSLQRQSKRQKGRKAGFLTRLLPGWGSLFFVLFADITVGQSKFFDSRYNRIAEIEKECISEKHQVSSHKKNRRLWLLRIDGSSHCFHKVEKEFLLFIGQRIPPRKQGALFIGKLPRLVSFCEELCQGYAESIADRFKCGKRGRIVSVEHIRDRGMGELRFLCKPVIRPSAFFHQFPYAFLCIHFITCQSVTIIIPKKVL